MTSSDTRDPGSGWGEALPLPLTPPKPKASAQPAPADGAPDAPPAGDDHGVEIGGPRGPEPTRYHDWEVKGRCSDF
ncbi:succinate dehydrogenase assembly factor 4 [Roseospira visakhapatnamensis]|uniref:DUF1674 domain-containing protein n=1 Tax=Roseospira visakhapatnamensis TaxID=390880 RepID=A0A7W6W981_9PROT|nr:hypothetical protein [Roseospira visakhapatnamensis]